MSIASGRRGRREQATMPEKRKYKVLFRQEDGSWISMPDVRAEQFPEAQDRALDAAAARYPEHPGKYTVVVVAERNWNEASAEKKTLVEWVRT